MYTLGGIFNKTCPFRRLTTHSGASNIQLITFDAVGAPEQLELGVSQINVRLKVELGPTSRLGRELEKLLVPFWASISVQSLESLNVIQGYDYSVATWRHIFASLEGAQLKHLEVIGNGSGIPYLVAFSTCLPQAAALEGRFPLSSLRELVIKRWDFSEMFLGISCFERLKTCLEDRKKHHAAIHKLSLADCRRVTPDSVGKFREVVSHVTWNRTSMFYEHDDGERSDSDLWQTEHVFDGYEYDSDLDSF